MNPVNQEDRALLQSRIDVINSGFTSGATAARKKVSEETTQGQIFNGPESVSRHLVDGIAGGWEEFLALI